MDLCLRWAVLLAASLWCFFPSSCFKNVDRGETPVLGKNPCNGLARVLHQVCSVYPCLGFQMRTHMQTAWVGAGKDSILYCGIFLSEKAVSGKARSNREILTGIS